jgi:ABC-2 type transport system ATP-binding protein
MHCNIKSKVLLIAKFNGIYLSRSTNLILQMTLKIKNVSKTYGNGVHALKDVTLTVPRGMFGLLGPNGAGKSTLMRILATLQQPDTGEINLFLPATATHSGKMIDVIKEKADVRKTLGYLPQDFGVYPRASAIGLLEHFSILKGYHERKPRKVVIESLLKKTNLWDARKQKLGGYSGGMLQRFGIAVALLGDPELLIVDEPTAGLDPAERVRFLNLLSELGENSVVILSTHIVEDVRELCGNMAVIDRGEILLQAQPIEATQKLRGKIWRQIIDKSALETITQRHAVISTKLFAGRTIVHVYSEENPGNGFEAVEPDLQDVYFCAIAGHVGNRKLVTQ